MIDELPQGWVSVPLGELGAYFNGRAFKPSEWEQRGLPIIRIQNLNDTSAPFNYSSKTFDERVRVKNGDLLIAWSASLGAFIWNGGDAWLNQHIFRVEHVASICTKHFLYYSVRHALDDLYLKAHGSGMVHVTKPVFEAQQVPLPPIPEQRRIVEKLEQLLGKVDDCRKRMSRISKFLVRFRLSVLAAACSGRLTNDWRVQQNGGTAPDETAAESDDLPSGWREVSIGDVIEDLKYGTSQKCGYEKRGVPVLRIPNVAKGVIDHGDLKYAELSAKEQKQLYLLPGDILIVRSNGSVSLVGKCALVGEKERGFSYAGYLIRIRPNQSLVSPEFLNLSLSSYNTRLQIELEARSTSGVNNINSKEVLALRLPLPPLDEQTEIVQRVNALFAYADKIERRYKAVQEQVERLPPSILAKAFSGELVPTETDIAEREGRPYEPAEELLKRVRNSNEDLVDSRNAPIDGISLDDYSEAVSIDKLRQTRFASVPEKSGVYVIIRPSTSEPRFISKSTGGRFKGLDPSYPINVVHENWVDGAHVMYVGMTASEGGLRSRLRQFFNFGAGKSIGHRGGRLLWHLEDSGGLLVRWRTCAASKADSAETAAIASFKSVYDGRRPFANMAK